METFRIQPYMFEPESEPDGESEHPQLDDLVWCPCGKCPKTQTEVENLRRWETPELQDNWAEINPPQDQFTGTQLNLSEMCTSTTEKQTPQHIVDEEAILQLMKNCPKCNRTCRCTKHTRGSYLIAYQKCYFCDYQRKWASQPEAKTINIHKASTPHKRKPSKDKVSVNAKAQSSQLNKIISESSSPTTQ